MREVEGPHSDAGYERNHLGPLHRQHARPPTTPSLRNSLVYAAAATVIALAVGTLAALVVVHGRRSLRHVVDLGLTLPLGTSAVTVGFGVLIALDTPPLDLRSSAWIVPVVHSLVGIPFVVRTMVPVLRRIDPALREAAAVLGASPARVRREVDAPIAGRGLLVGAMVCEENDQLFAIASNGVVIRTRVGEIRPSGRDTMGVTLMNLSDGDSVVGVARGGEVETDEEDEESGAPSDETAAGENPVAETALDAGEAGE